METTEIARVAMLLIMVGLMWFILRRVQKNRAALTEEAPVAGADEIGGQAKHPEQFDEPDDDALDEMQDLLESAAESQGIVYEE